MDTEEDPVRAAHRHLVERLYQLEPGEHPDGRARHGSPRYQAIEAQIRPLADRLWARLAQEEAAC